MKSFFATLVIGALSFTASANDKLNFVLVLVDDMGWVDLACQGSDYYKTPHIDKLAAEGTRFTHGYAASAVCSPTRSAVQTGKYPARTGVTDWIRSRFQRGGIGTPEANPTEFVGAKNRQLLCPPNPYWMEHEEVTIAEALKPAGYQSAYIGKWHLGDDAWYPEGQGYDINIGGCDYGQPPSFFDPYNQPNHKHEMIRAGIPGLPGRKEGEFLTHREADEAATLIKKWAKDDQPFFLNLGNYAVHTPIQALPEVAAKYEQEGKAPVHAKYAAMVESVDDAIGTIVTTLEETGQLDNTVIIFTSDNGGLDRNDAPTDNAPLRSGKGYHYEGGIRVPFIVRWPGVAKAGVVSDTPVNSIDIFPTIMEAAGIEHQGTIDGISLVDHLRGGEIERDVMTWHFPHYRHGSPYSIIRKGDWKLIHHWEGQNELFNLKEDPSEETDLAAKESEKVEALKAELISELEKQGAKIPRPNPEFAAAKKK
ncbi:MAG: sulfatase [Verrucomicrobiota bacterium]